MVRATLEGRKTVTRRVIKPKFGGAIIAPGGRGIALESLGDTIKTNLCPYGVSGDRLWVRETLEKANGVAVGYPADGSWLPCTPWMWKRNKVPSIHMPRWASRILLEITDVRVERLQDITPEQALAEGVKSCERDLDPVGNDYSPYELFSMLWTSINGMESWNTNPWVWAVEFKRVTP